MPSSDTVTKSAWFDDVMTRPSTSIDPFNKRLCCSSRFIALPDWRSVAVRAGTVVAFGIEWSATERAGRSSGLDQTGDGDRQCAGPLTRQRQDQFVVTLERFERDLEAARLFVEGDRDVTGDE